MDVEGGNGWIETVGEPARRVENMVVSDSALKKRVEQAWSEAREWITDFDGSPTITLLVNVPAAGLLPGLRALAEETENFRITAIFSDRKDDPEFISLDDFADHLDGLKEGRVDELSVNYASRSGAFDLDIHMVIHWIDAEKLALQVVWWSDQVFSAETDHLEQFSALAAYFIHLQDLFSAANLFISPEGDRDPLLNLEGWVEL